MRKTHLPSGPLFDVLDHLLLPQWCCFLSRSSCVPGLTLAWMRCVTGNFRVSLALHYDNLISSAGRPVSPVITPICI